MSNQSSDLPEEVNRPLHVKRKRENPYELWGRNSSDSPLFARHWSRWGAYTTRKIAEENKERLERKYHSLRWGKAYEFEIRVVLPGGKRRRNARALKDLK